MKNLTLLIIAAFFLCSQVFATESPDTRPSYAFVHISTKGPDGSRNHNYIFLDIVSIPIDEKGEEKIYDFENSDNPRNEEFNSTLWAVAAKKAVEDSWPSGTKISIKVYLSRRSSEYRMRHEDDLQFTKRIREENIFKLNQKYSGDPAIRTIELPGLWNTTKEKKENPASNPNSPTQREKNIIANDKVNVSADVKIPQQSNSAKNTPLSLSSNRVEREKLKADKFQAQLLAEKMHNEEIRREQMESFRLQSMKEEAYRAKISAERAWCEADIAKGNHSARCCVYEKVKGGTCTK